MHAVFRIIVHFPQMIQHIRKGFQLCRSAADTRIIPGVRDDFIQRNAEVFRNFRRIVHCRIPDPALWLIDNAAQADTVLRVLDHAEVRHGVTNLLGVIKAMAANHTVRNAAFYQRPFHGVGLRIRPIQYRKVAVFSPISYAFKNRVGNKTPLFVFVVERVYLQLVPFRILGPERFPLPVLVFGNNCIGGIQDILGGTVILLKADDLTFLKLVLEIQYVLNRSAAEFINALVVIADHA